ncbi:helix-turn-helix domain-containing protein [Psychroserpens sp. Hel_I_66]|uniref:helix-turn-helix domain-containing protein n=1 Tax=Psychroserpens sp. Hel_I_66 TaxID=1250004 RepID=UPI0006469E8A|nr:AraC family transcriptional regulator [Psychroserpens sp. Hel_I_66]
MAKSIKISDVTAHGIMTSISKQLNIDYTNEGDDYCIEIDDSLGKGYFRGIQFSHGLSVIESSLIPTKKTSLEFENQDINLLQLLFNVDSALTHHVSEDKEKHNISKLQYCMFSNDITNNHLVNLPKQKSSSFFIILINRKEFEEKISSIAEGLSPELEIIFKDVNGVNLIHHTEYFSLELSKYIEEFRQCDLEEFMKPMYLEGKAYEILTHQLQSYNNEDSSKKKILLRKVTIDKIEKAVEIIKDELDVRINVYTLAKRVGLNQNTLQNGFKSLFQTSVNEFIKSHRLEKAKILIENSNLNITEITYKIGINSRSYFSKLFKERFGISPSEYISKVRNKKDISA